MIKKNIYILIEYFKREFHSNSLLSLLAANKNYNVFIGTTRVYNKLINENLLPAGIFHTKSITHGKEKTNFNKILKEKNFILTSIDEENGLIHNYNYYEIFIKSRVQIKDLKYFTSFFCWGKYDFKNLTNSLKYYKKKFICTGSPRVDLWKKDFKSLWVNPTLKKKNYILIVSNFAYSNNFFSFGELVRRQNKAGYYKRSPQYKKQEFEYFTYQKKTMKKYIELTNYLSKNLNKNQKIIFRPHPGEKNDFWKNKFKNLDNVEIKSKGNIAPLIKNSMAIIQTGCTSSFEAFISDIPVINYIPFKTNGHKFGEFAKSFSNNYKKKEEILKFLRQKKMSNQKKKELVNKRIMFLDKELSANKIVNHWSYLLKDKKSIKTNIILIKLKLIFFEIVNIHITRMILLFKGKWTLQKLIFHKFLDFDFKEITKFFIDLKKILKIKKNIKIKKLSKEFYMISSR